MRSYPVCSVGVALWIWGLSLSAPAQTQPGEVWEWRNPLPQGHSLMGVTRGMGVFVAVGEGGAIVTSASGESWKSRISGTTSRLRRAGWNGNQFLAVGDAGTLLTSPDGVNWTPQTSGVASTLWDVASDGNQSAVVGDGGTILTSSDGAVWTGRTSGTFRPLRGIAWGNGQFVAVGEYGVILTSPDGVAWIARASGTTSTLTSLVWSGSQFVAVGSSGALVTSPDGDTWTTAALGTSSTLNGVAWSGSRFVVLGPNGYVYTSPDGVAWALGPNRVGTTAPYGLAWGNDQFVAVGLYGAIHASPDGTNWTARLMGETQDLHGVAWNGSRFAAVGDSSSILTSPDGLDWTKAAYLNNYSTLLGIAWGNNLFVTVGFSIYGNVLSTSADGRTWTVRSAGLGTWDGTLRAVTWADNQFVAVGDASASSVESPIVTSPNGVNWTKRESGTIQALNAVAGSGDQFVAVGAAGTVLTSPSGIDWTVHSVWEVYNGSLLGIAWGNHQFVAVGGAILTSPDGTTWTKQVSGTSLSAIIWNGLEFVAVGSGGGILTSPDGVNWTPRASGSIRNFTAAAWNGAQFVAVGEKGAILGSGTGGSTAGRILSPLRSGTLVAGDTLRFTAAPSGNAELTGHWDFGDGRSSAVASPGLLRYADAGTFEVVYSASLGAEALGTDTRSYTVVPDTGDIADLEVIDATLVGTLAVGEAVQIRYSVRNLGPGAAGPEWQDALFLSRDAYLDAGDLLLNTMEVTEDLAAGATCQKVMDATLPAAYAGGCHLLLVVNHQWEILERHRLNNEHARQITDLVPALTAGADLSVPYGAGRVEHYFRLTAPGGHSLLLSLADVSADLEILIQFGGLPSGGGGHAYQVRGGGEFLIPAATAGDWYLMVRGDMAHSGTYALGFSLTELALSASSPTKHQAGAALQLTLTGAGFVAPLAVQLVSGEGLVYDAERVEVDGWSQATAAFAVGSLPTGSYSIRVDGDGQVAELAGALEVAAGGQARLETRLIMSSSLGYHSLSTLYVEYENAGDAPMPAPVLVVTATQNGRAGAILTLDPSRLQSGFWTSVLPAGFAHAVQFIASGDSPGLLQPGESGRVPVYYAGWQQPWDFDYPPLQWHVGVLDADADDPIDWGSLKDPMRPDYVREDAWDVVWDNFTSQAGSTWGGYVAMLTRNARYLHRHRVEVKDLQSLLAFSVRLADGISPVMRLAGGADAAVRAPGLPLTFGRTFLQPISRRFALGDLGRGWTHNWQQSLAVRQDGKVVISDLTGTPRLFNPDSRHAGRYLAQPGDRGDLRAVNGGFRLTEATGGGAFFRDGKLEYVEDANGNRITCQYSDGRLSRLGHSAGGYLQLTYNTEGYIASVADSHGQQTTYGYEGEHLAYVRANDGRTTTYTYVASGAARHALSDIGLPNGTTRHYEYDERGRLTETWRNAREELVHFGFGEAGRVEVTDALGNTSRLFYDHWGRLIQTENPLGEIVQLRLDELGRLLSVTDPEGGIASYAYDQRGNVSEITDSLRHTTRLVHARAFNRLSRVTDALNRRTDYGYDEQGNLTSISYPDGSREEWERDGRGQASTWTNRRGRVISFEYDAAGRILRKEYADGGSADYRHDAKGRLVEAEDARGVTSFTYNEHDYLARVEYPGDRWLAFDYDAVGRRTASEDQTGHRIEYHYDTSSRLSRISGAQGDIVSYTYDPLGRVARQTSGNGVYADHAYDPAGRPLSLVNHLPDGEVLSRFDYTYDRRGRRTAMETHYGTWEYTYDDGGRLIRAVLASTDAAIPDQDLIYEYDALGNRVRTRVNGVEQDYESNRLNQYTTVGDCTYRYDLDGNLIEEAGPEETTVYTYNDENRLVGVTRGDSEWHYNYDALGNRVAVDDNGAVTHYVYDPVGLGNLVAEYDESGNLLTRYTHGVGLVSRWNATDGESYYSFDPMSNTSEITGPAGELQNACAYRPFGELILDSQVVPDPFKFMGQVGIMADTTGLYDVRWRQYDAPMGRFASADPLGLSAGEMGFYTYAANQPTMTFDPTGLYGCALAQSVAKTVFGGFEVGGGMELFGLGMAGAPETGGGSLVLSGFGLALSVGGIYDVVTGLMGILWNGSALVCDHLGLLSAEDRLLADAVSDALDPSVAGVVVSLATRDWETYDYNRDAVQIADIIAGLATGAVSPQSAADVCTTVLEGTVDSSLSFGFCAHNKDPVAPPDASGAKWRVVTSRVAAPADPNSKTGVAGHGELNFVAPDRLLSYRIDFENHPLATAPAQVVTLRDPLSPQLDWSTLELGEIGFGSVSLQVPPGLQHYETVVDYDYQDDDYDFLIEVHIEAWLENGTLYCNFLSIDPDTGLPPPVDLGFLMPETDPATGRGRGYVTYVIRPRAGLPTGTAIRNVATVQFDFGETIDTNQVDPHDPSQGTDPRRETLTTLDAAPPTSTVAALPAEAGPTFLVEWSGEDDPGGAGLESYDVHVIENGANDFIWLSGTLATNAWFRGEPGSAYAFFSVARDHVGNIEALPMEPQALTGIPTTAPVLATLTDVELAVGTLIEQTNHVSGTPAGSWLFSLGMPAPEGLLLNPTNGVMRWTPSCSDASTTHQVTVWVTDTGNPYLADAIQFTAVVGECVTPGLGRLVLRTGESGRVPIDLISTVPLTDFAMTVEAPTDRLTDLQVEPVVPGICTQSLVSLGNSLYELSLATCADQWLIGTQQVAWLHFTASSAQPSAFVSLRLDNITGVQADGTPVSNFAPQSGRVAIVGAEPLLEALPAPDDQVQLLQYAQPGTTVTLEWTPGLPPIAGWQRLPGVLQTNLVQESLILPPGEPRLFFRAVLE